MEKINWEQRPSFLVWNKVKRLRKERGFSQLQVAAAADISITTLWMIESGFDGKTTIKTKGKIAAFFDCDVEDIFPCEMIGNQTRDECLKGKQS